MTNWGILEEEVQNDKDSFWKAEIIQEDDEFENEKFYTRNDIVFKAMDQYAKQEAIEFHLWIHRSRRYSMYNDGFWDSGVSPQEFKSVHEVYKKFIQSKETNNG